MGKVIKINNLTAQEEIFCQWYTNTVDNVFSAYQAGFCNQVKNETPYDELSLTYMRNLSRAGKTALKKKEVKERISELADQEAKKHKKAQLEEVLSFLTAVMRKAKSQNLDNIHTIREALTAVSILIKHYPDFEGGAKSEQKYNFARRRKSE